MDAGIKFPEDDLLGIDRDSWYSYIVENIDRVKGSWLLTDTKTISIPFLLKQANVCQSMLDLWPLMLFVENWKNMASLRGAKLYEINQNTELTFKHIKSDLLPYSPLHFQNL